MSRVIRTERVLEVCGVVAVALFVVASFAGAAAANPGSQQGDAPTADTQAETDPVRSNNLSQQDPDSSASMGVCMIGVSSPCNSEGNENPSLRSPDRSDETGSDRFDGPTEFDGADESTDSGSDSTSGGALEQDSTQRDVSVISETSGSDGRQLDVVVQSPNPEL